MLCYDFWLCGLGRNSTKRMTVLSPSAQMAHSKTHFWIHLCAVTSDKLKLKWNTNTGETKLGQMLHSCILLLALTARKQPGGFNKMFMVVNFIAFYTPFILSHILL